MSAKHRVVSCAFRPVEMKVRVLVVEDERRLADSIAEPLRHHAMAVDVAYDGEAGPLPP